jgi:hypothetical protein
MRAARICGKTADRNWFPSFKNKLSRHGHEVKYDKKIPVNTKRR